MTVSRNLNAVLGLDKVSNFIRMRLPRISIGPRVCYFSQGQFVPLCDEVKESEILHLHKLVSSKSNIVVLTGAGVSTESGIPDYRSERVGIYARTNYRPVQYTDFVQSVLVRKRYWARNFAGWEQFSNKQPNKTHYCLAQLQKQSRIKGIITQNVDQLHAKAGSTNVIELHGNSFIVRCLKCEFNISRQEFQKTLTSKNKPLTELCQDVRPDGDVELSSDFILDFNVPPCPSCGHVLKPGVVFFGENIPRPVLDEASKMVLDADCLLALGTSLQVFSGYRLVLQAYERGIPIAIVNIGPTRADSMADIKISGKCSNVISKLFMH